MADMIVASVPQRLLRSPSVRVAAIAGLMSAAPATADIVEVLPGESIQAVIDDPETENGDEIVLAPGVYLERIDLRGRPLTVRSIDPRDEQTVAATVLDGRRGGSVITCAGGEAADTMIAGLTIVGGQADSGGGMYIEGASPTVVACRFIGNTATFDGAGIFVLDGAPTIVNCLFAGGASFYGAGIANIQASPLVTGCIFTGNDAVNFGGGVDNFNASDPTIVGCTFAGNSADRGGAISNERSSPFVANALLWGDTARVTGDEIDNRDGSMPFVRHSDVAGSGGSELWDGALGIDGGGNIDVDPAYVDASGADGIPGTDDDDLRLGLGSGAIDAGRNADAAADVTDLDGDGNDTEPAPLDAAGAPRFRDDPATSDTGDGETPLIDIGAYEYQPGLTCTGDLDGNGTVGARDLTLLVAGWGPCDRCVEDLDGNGIVNFRDLLAMLVRWGPCSSDATGRRTRRPKRSAR